MHTAEVKLLSAEILSLIRRIYPLGHYFIPLHKNLIFENIRSRRDKMSDQGYVTGLKLAVCYSYMTQYFDSILLQLESIAILFFISEPAYHCKSIPP